jgi:RNA polymerase sigma factor (sigma-70 family)
LTDWLPDIARLQALDDAEWARVQEHYCGRLLAYAQRRTGDRQLAEDVLQETLLGAVRGIKDFDPSYSFEQYLFGICKNRTIDSLRRRAPRTLERSGDESQSGEMLLIETETASWETPSAVVRRRELSQQAKDLLGRVLREWVEESWREGEFQRLLVIEALLAGGWRNRDTWKKLGLRDETAVAGIKFRALKRLSELAARMEESGDLLRSLKSSAEFEEGMLDLDIREVWREKRVSCPNRQWLARLLAGSLEPGQAEFVRFHLEAMGCPWCLANRDDLARSARAAELEPLVERVHRSTLKYLRSRGNDTTVVRKPRREGPG